MSHSFHVSLSTILKKLPQLPNDHYYFYLLPEYRELQRKLETITQDMVLVTVRCNTDTRTLLFEYTGVGYNKEVHEKALELVRGKYIFLYQHENPLLNAEKSMTRYLDQPDTCNQIYLYIEDGKKQNGNGYLILAPEGENYINPTLLPVGQPLSPESTCFISFSRPTRRKIYIDLKPLGNQISQMKMKEKLMFSMPHQQEPYFCRNLPKLWEDDLKENGVVSVTDKKYVIQIPLNVVEDTLMRWQTYAKEMPYVTQQKVIESATQYEKTITKMPSAEIRKLNGEKGSAMPLVRIETPKERDFNALHLIHHTVNTPNVLAPHVVVPAGIQPVLPPGNDGQVIHQRQQEEYHEN